MEKSQQKKENAKAETLISEMEADLTEDGTKESHSDAPDEEQLKQEYGYQSKEECLVHFMPNGVYEQERKEAEAADHLKGWQLKCTADRYSEEEGAFVVSDEPVYLDFLVDDEKENNYGRSNESNSFYTVFYGDEKR